MGAFSASDGADVVLGLANDRHNTVRAYGRPVSVRNGDCSLGTAHPSPRSSASLMSGERRSTRRRGRSGVKRA